VNEQIIGLQQEVETLRAKLATCEAAGGAHPPGHFYSPLPSAEDIAGRLAEADRTGLQSEIAEIDLGVERQFANLARIREAVAGDVPFPEEQHETFRYYYKNSQYSYNDGIMLFGMLRSIRPKRIIEIGSGFSSALILDTNDLYMNNSVSCSFIEPYPDRLNALLRENDRLNCQIYTSRVQDVDLAIFSSLEAGDILFVDSSHIVKYGSDLEYILRVVLPALQRGVVIHFHDIFFPFEYPVEVVRLGHFWNECYMLRAFLANNDTYRIELFGDFIRQFHLREIETISPLCLKNSGAHLWISKLPSA
jgi:predicted O-methyltransferase YrrM